MTPFTYKECDEDVDKIDSIHPYTDPSTGEIKFIYIDNDYLGYYGVTEGIKIGNISIW